MLMTKERPRGIRTLRGWAISVLQEAGAIRECEEHAWATDRADPHARDRAFEIAEQDPPSGTSPAEAVSEVRQVLDSIGDPAPSVRRRPLAAGGDGCLELCFDPGVPFVHSWASFRQRSPLSPKGACHAASEA